MAQTLQLSWMNYPYLSIETEVTPQTVKVGETVEVTVRVKGDGWALMPTPIDAMLCTDRSGSMLWMILIAWFPLWKLPRLSREPCRSTPLRITSALYRLETREWQN